MKSQKLSSTAQSQIAHLTAALEGNVELYKFLFIDKYINIGRSQLKKMNFFLVSQVKVVLDVIEGEKFTYRYQNDVSARQSRKIEPLFSKKRPYFGLTYHPEEVIF